MTLFVNAFAIEFSIVPKNKKKTKKTLFVNVSIRFLCDKSSTFGGVET
jgi:hypothetical protein